MVRFLGQLRRPAIGEGKIHALKRHAGAPGIFERVAAEKWADLGIVGIPEHLDVIAFALEPGSGRLGVEYAAVGVGEAIVVGRVLWIVVGVEFRPETQRVGDFKVADGEFYGQADRVGAPE